MIGDKKFQRKKEDFNCEYCGTFVTGTGYTNHCNKCLFSKHVDVYPGDRREPCGGLMKPLKLEMEKGEYVIVHQCQKCGLIRRNKSASNDTVDLLLKP